MRLTALTSVFCAIAAMAHAVGLDDPTPPKTTQTSTECTEGQIYDTATQTCVDAQESHLDDDTRYGAVRELAYAGQFDRARRVLATMSDQGESRVWTYKGFIARKTGDQEAAMRYYDEALRVDADNILARSYMGQALVISGDTKAARLQLSEIRVRGGRNGWAEYALKAALASGRAVSY